MLDSLPIASLLQGKYLNTKEEFYMRQLTSPKNLQELIEHSLDMYKQFEDSLVSLNKDLCATSDIANSNQVNTFLKLQSSCESIDTDIMRALRQDSSTISLALKKKNRPTNPAYEKCFLSK